MVKNIEENKENLDPAAQSGVPHKDSDPDRMKDSKAESGNGGKAAKKEAGARETARGAVRKIEDSSKRIDEAVKRLDDATTKLNWVCETQEQLLEKVESLVGFFDDGKDGLKVSMMALSDYLVAQQSAALRSPASKTADEISRIGEAAKKEIAALEDEAKARTAALKEISPHDKFFIFLGKFSLAAAIVSVIAIVIWGLLL